MESHLRYFAGSNSDISALRVERPDGIPEENWAAIQTALDRLNLAIKITDLSQAIGCAKDLVEAIAKVVLDVKGQTSGSKADFQDVVGEAHAELDRQPGEGLAADPTIRNIAQGARKIVNNISEIRNLYGTGHGRAIEPNVVDELALVTIDAALLWVRWALRRLRFVIIGRPATLIQQLDRGNFRRGLLTEQLRAANLKELSTSDQRLIGLHVAWRAIGETFLVRQEGVEACTSSLDVEKWPTGYRTGLLNGLVLTETGLINTDPWAVGQMAALLRSTHNIDVDFTVLISKVKNASYSPSLLSNTTLPELEQAVRQLASSIPADLKATWIEFGARIEVPF